MVADSGSSQGLGEGGGCAVRADLIFCRVGELHKVPFSPLRLFLTLVLFSPTQQWVLGLTAPLRSWSPRDCAASITVQLTDWTTTAAEAMYRAGGGDDGGGGDMREGERSDTCPHHLSGLYCHLGGWRNFY